MFLRRLYARYLLHKQVGCLKGSPKAVSKDELWTEYLKLLNDE